MSKISAVPIMMVVVCSVAAGILTDDLFPSNLVKHDVPSISAHELGGDVPSMNGHELGVDACMRDCCSVCWVGRCRSWLYTKSRPF